MGFTATEDILQELAFQSFLSLWSYPNIFRDQHNGKSVEGKEITDLAVIFENNLLLFSDKKCLLKLDKGKEIGWGRWYKDAIIESAKQCKGAYRWIKNFPDRIFLDKTCNQRIPIELPKEPDVKLILISNGSNIESIEDESLSFKIHKNKEDKEFLSVSSYIDGIFYHIFNEHTLKYVVENFDTITDFLDYLNFREEYIDNLSEESYVLEEEIALEYGQRPETIIKNFGVFGDRIDFILESNQNLSLLLEISYGYDKIIEHFTEYIGQYKTQFDVDESKFGVEKGLRKMAALRRTHRAYISDFIAPFLADNTVTGDYDVRTIIKQGILLPAFVILKAINKHNEDDLIYRQRRLEILMAYMHAAKLKDASVGEVIGIAIDMPGNIRYSEDFVAFDLANWTPSRSERKHLRRIGVIK